MEIIKESSGAALTIKLRGRLDTATAPALAAKMAGSARDAMVLRTRTSPVARTVPMPLEADTPCGSAPI